MSSKSTRRRCEVLLPENLNRNLNYLRLPQRFNSYTKQYAPLYFARLTKLGPRCTNLAQRKWAGKGVVQVERVLDLPKNSLCFVTGTIFMDLKLKPNVLTELAKFHHLVPPVDGDFKYFDPEKPSDEHVSLEDSSGRVNLLFTEQKWPLVTGLIVSILGRQKDNGDFEVVDMCFPGLPKQDSKVDDDGMEVDEEEGEQWVALVSGLEFGAADQEGGDEKLDLLQEYLTGELSTEEERKSVSQITALVIAGNSMIDTTDTSITPLPVLTKKEKTLQQSKATQILPPTHFGRFISPILPSLPVVLQPGPLDPSSVLIPQPPLHPYLLPPPASNFGDRSLKLAGNPAYIQIGSCTLLSGAGTNVRDVERYVHDSFGKGVKTAERLLQWGHDAPTAPDTLACFPFQNTDPFVIDHCPDIYVIGNQNRFGTKLIFGEDGQRVRIVMLPRFRSSGELVLVELKSLDVKVVKFGE